jgi:hypothetical protein
MGTAEAFGGRVPVRARQAGCHGTDPMISDGVVDSILRNESWRRIYHDPHPGGYWYAFSCGCEHSSEDPSVWLLCRRHAAMQDEG